MKRMKQMTAVLLATACLFSAGAALTPAPARAFLGADLAELGAILEVVKEINGALDQVHQVVDKHFGMFKDVLGEIKGLAGKFQSMWNEVESLEGRIEGLAELPEQLSQQVRQSVSSSFSLYGYGGGWGETTASGGDEPTSAQREIEESKAIGEQTYTRTVRKYLAKQSAVQWGYGTTMRNVYSQWEPEGDDGEWKRREDPEDGTVLKFAEDMKDFYKEMSEQVQGLEVSGSGAETAEAKLALEQTKILAELLMTNGMVMVRLLQAQSDANDMLAAQHFTMTSREYERMARGYLSGVQSNVGSGASLWY